jgi:hypothetical protein
MQGAALLHKNKAPELARTEIVHVPAAQWFNDSPAAMASARTDPGDRRHVRRDLSPTPTSTLLVELELQHCSITLPVIRSPAAKQLPNQIKA